MNQPLTLIQGITAEMYLIHKFQVVEKSFSMHVFPLWIIDPKGNTIPEEDLKLKGLQKAMGVVSKLHLLTAKILTSKKVHDSITSLPFHSQTSEYNPGTSPRPQQSVGQ